VLAVVGWAESVRRTLISTIKRSSTGALDNVCRLALEDAVRALERACDEWNEDLPELKSFVLPGGSELSARLHVARTVCRRVEREALAAAQEVDLNPLALVYLNRLSDLLFILARAANTGGEPLWKPGASR